MGASQVVQYSIPESGRAPKLGNGNQSQYFCLKNSMAQGAGQVTDHAVTKSQTQLSKDAMYLGHLKCYPDFHQNAKKILKNALPVK